MNINVRTAPTYARKLCKSLAFRRRELHGLSKKERDKVQGADRAVDEQIATIRRHIHRANTAVTATEAVGDDLFKAHLILESGTVKFSDSPVSGLAALAYRLGLDAQVRKAISVSLASAATKIRQSADAALDRLDDHDDDIKATEHLCDLSIALRAHGFDDRNTRVKRIKRDMAFHRDSHKERHPR